MHRGIRGKYQKRLMCGAAALALAVSAGQAVAREETDRAVTFAIAAQPLADGLNEFARQSGRPVMFTPQIAAAKTTGGFSGAVDADAALGQMLAGTGLAFRRSGDTYLIVQQGGSGDPQSAGAGGDVDALIVTAQKREENIQDVPIAISAFSQEELTTRQVAGGPDLMTQVPNMTFTKTNFSSYSIQIRGIGTQAISATTDAAVAVAFNNTPFIRNRFFEQEFYDLQRVEVLRGPQGTLYGRNATAGVVNIISAKPAFRYEAKASGDVANYKSTRVEGMVNLPLVEDMVALRVAGAWTKRDGFVENGITGNPIDGRDLWSTRVSLRVAPNDRLDANLIWEHFEEDDDRLRSGKQLCHTHEITQVGDFQTGHYDVMWGGGQERILFNGVQATFSQGCAAASLYAPESFQTPNGLSLPYYAALAFGLGLPAALADPYASRTQSTDLRVIESTVDPQYRAQSDLFELQVNFDLGGGLTLSSETSYSSDTLFSTQDFNRFNTAAGAWIADVTTHTGPDGFEVFCDPQVGCADRLVAVDLSTAVSNQFSQEFRLASDYDGPFNFSLGANFLRYDTEDKYYVFINSLTMVSAGRATARGSSPPYVQGVSDNHECLKNGEVLGQPNRVYSVIGCVYIDPNPIGSLNDKGHNYFLSRNPYKLISYAVFGEAYYNITDNLKVTGGLRWTVDKKEAPRIPSWLLASETVGYPVAEVIEQEWREPTGRLTVDWKPDFSFTDETLLYASFAHGYKAGGSNPPNYTFVFFVGDDEAQSGSDKSATRPKTFEPEFIDALELGAKNTFADGRVTVNLAAFYYDYEGYQISEIVDRSAFNRNFDATVWGLEIEADWRPLENLRLGFKGGYENTSIADGERAIDLMDRTAGMPGWVVVSPFPTFASNCILPEFLFIGNYDFFGDEEGPIDILVNPGGIAGGNPSACEVAYLEGHDPVTEQPYVPNPPNTGFYQDYYPNYPGWNPLDASQGHNNGEGFFKELGGNELPNAPNFTATITADYTLPLPADWLVTLHTDLYYQSEAWTRVFNTEGYDKLKAYSNVNLAAIFTNDEAGWRVMAYVKNVFDRDSITGSFLNSDDTGLTTNVFLTEPRLYGVRVTKDWNGGPWWTGAGPDHTGPYLLTLELGGQVQRADGPYSALTPGFADAFSPTLNIFDDTQNQDLDWGDGREVKLTYRPSGSTWFLSAGLRTGKSNSSNIGYMEEAASEPVCGMPGPLAKYCDPQDPTYRPEVSKYATNVANATVWNKEEHRIVDFAIGRDLGIGALGEGRSSLGLGLRYARLQSATDLVANGIPNWHLPEGWFAKDKYPSTHDDYVSHHSAQREFTGMGPVLSWAAATRILDGDDAGSVDLDWSVGAGVLFGKQRASITGEERSGYFSGGFFYDTVRYGVLTDVQTTPVAIHRSESANVPVLDLSLGLSYEIQRVKVGAGYRWERYFDAIDGGFAEHQSYDRTIDGPYFKVSIGFGG